MRRLARLVAKPPLLPFYNRSSSARGGETRISAQAISHALDRLGVPPARTRIPARVAIQHAAIARVPIVAYRPDHIASTAFEQLATDALAEAA
jgi:cellulose biosynthesis protein BcsQ